MNDDLHDIDDLFRERFEGYHEDAPPAAWEAVSNNLDKQQASFYKNKYNRLKKAALVLLLLCFLGGTYVIFDVVKDNKTDKGTTVKEKQPTAILPFSQEKSEGNVDKRNGSNNDVNKSNNLQKKTEQNEKEIPAHDSLSFTHLQSSTEKQSDETTANSKKNVNSHKAAVLSGLSAVNKEKSRKLFFTKDSIAKQKEKQPVEQLYVNQRIPLSATALQPISLTNKDNSTPTVNLQTLLEKHQPVLPSNTTSPSNNILAATSKTKNLHGFALSIFAAPNISFNRLEEDHHRGGPGNGEGEHREEKKKISLSSGVLLNYELGKNVSIQSGVSVTTFSTSIEPKTIYADADNNGHVHYKIDFPLGYSYISSKEDVQPGDSAITSGSTSRLTYLSIPASLSYHISIGKHLSISPAVGANLNILTGNKLKTSVANTAGSHSATTSINGLKPTYVDEHIGIGMEYRLNQKFSIGIQPNARFSLTPVNKETPVKSYQNFLSIETGVRIKL